VKRRDFIALAGGGATASWVSPRQVGAQPPPRPVVGFLGSAEPIPEVFASFLEGLAAAGFSDGRNVTVIYRWAHNQPDRLPALAADLLRNQPAVIATNGGAIVVRAARAASASVPIVFLVGADPAAAGLVDSLARPGGHATGVHMLTSALNGKRLQLLHEMVPRVATIGLLVNPASPGVDAAEAEMRAAADSAAVRLLVLRAGTGREIDAAFATLAEKRIGALMLSNDPSIVGAGSWWRWRRAVRCPPSSNGASSPQAVA
jgi:putative ABC transport system substrate-binding protein